MGHGKVTGDFAEREGRGKTRMKKKYKTTKDGDGAEGQCLLPRPGVCQAATSAFNNIPARGMRRSRVDQYD